MTGNSLDEILSPSSDARTEAPSADTQPRDDGGRFAAKPAEQPAAAAPVEQPEAPESPQAPNARPEGGQVPQQALHASRQREREEKERADRLEREMAELRGKVSVLTQPKQEPTPEPEEIDFWVDPKGYHQQQVQPLRQEMQALASELSYEMASGKHGEETVVAAVNSLKAARQAGTLDPADAQKIMRSRFPFQEIVKWHQRASTLSEVGDIAAFKEKMRAEILAEIEAGNQNQQQPQNPPAPVLPTNLASIPNAGNRGGPAWQGPQPLNDIFDRTRKAKTA